MALDRSAKSWRDWNEINPWLFPSVLELAEDRGPMGELLRRCIQRKKEITLWVPILSEMEALLREMH